MNASDVVLAVEILSPGTRSTDRTTKLVEYADAGISGYWLIDLEHPTTLTAYLLVDGDYEIVAESEGEVDLITPVAAHVDLASLTVR